MKFLLQFSILLMTILTFGCSEKQTGEISEQQNEWLWAVDWNSENNMIATGGTQEILFLYAGQDRKLLKKLKVPGTITKIKWHPENNALAVATQGEQASSFILDVDNNERIYFDSICDFGARAIGWNKTGELLAVGDYDGVLSIFDREGQSIKRIDVEQKGLMGLAWHPSEDRMALVGERITLYDLEKDTIISIEDRAEEVLMLCVDWHPSGDFFVTGDYGDYDKNYPALLQFWSSEGIKIRAIESSKAEYRNLEWSNDGEVLVTASERLRLWSQQGDLVLEGPINHLLWGVDWSADETQIITTDKQGLIHIWNNNLDKLIELKYSDSDTALGH